MFNLKILSELGVASVKALADKFFSAEDYQGYQIAAYDKGRVDDILNLIGQNLSRLSSAGRSDLVKAYEKFSASDWRSILEKKSEKQKRLAQADSVARMQALNQTVENKQYQDKLQKEVEGLKSDLTRDIISFLQLNPTKSLKDFDFSTYEAVWKHLNHESDTEAYTKSSFPNFLNAIDVYKLNIGSANTPQAQPTVNPNDDSEDFGPLKWLVGGGLVFAALFGVWEFFSQIGKSTKPIESPTEVGGANISKQEVKRLIDLLDELQITLASEKDKLGDLKLAVRHPELSSGFLQYCETLQRIFVSGSVDHNTFTRVTPHIAFFIKYQAERYVVFEVVSQKYEVGSPEYKEDVEASAGYLLAVHLNILIAEAVIATNPNDRSGLLDTTLFVTVRELETLERTLHNLESSERVDRIIIKLKQLKARTKRLEISLKKAKG